MLREALDGTASSERRSQMINQILSSARLQDSRLVRQAAKLLLFFSFLKERPDPLAPSGQRMSELVTLRDLMQASHEERAAFLRKLTFPLEVPVTVLIGLIAHMAGAELGHLRWLWTRNYWPKPHPEENSTERALTFMFWLLFAVDHAHLRTWYDPRKSALLFALIMGKDGSILDQRVTKFWITATCFAHALLIRHATNHFAKAEHIKKCLIRPGARDVELTSIDMTAQSIVADEVDEVLAEEHTGDMVAAVTEAGSEVQAGPSTQVPQ